MEERLKMLLGEKKIDKRILSVVEKKCTNPNDIICCAGGTLCTNMGLRSPKMGIIVILRNNTFLFLEGNLFGTIHEFYFKNIINIYKTTSAKAVSTLRFHDASPLYIEIGLLTEAVADTVIKELWY